MAILVVAVVVTIFYLRQIHRKKGAIGYFPESWRDILKEHVSFYAQLQDNDKKLFENRTNKFLSAKHIEPVDTEIDDTIRLMVASSAIIPTFAFPEYNYPHVRTVLIYPNSFDEQFQTQRFEGHREFITGMVGNRFMNGTIILSKPDLVSAFDGKRHNENVGIHEFVHVLDKEDGAIDGVTELLLQHRYVGAWLREIKMEMGRIRTGASDINPYTLTNNAEFLAVVSEYFFSNPGVFHKKHPGLYKVLSSVYNTNRAEAGGH